MTMIQSMCLFSALAVLSACADKEEDKYGVPSSKTVEASEKNLNKAKGTVSENAGDVAKARETLEQEQSELQRARTDLEQMRAQFVGESEAKMADLTSRMNGLEASFEARSKELKEKDKRAMGKTIATFYEKQTEARKAFEAARMGSQEDWEQLKRNTGESLKAMETAYDEADSKLHE